MAGQAPQYPTFGALQQQGVARPPKAAPQMAYGGQGAPSGAADPQAIDHMGAAAYAAQKAAAPPGSWLANSYDPRTRPQGGVTSGQGMPPGGVAQGFQRGDEEFQWGKDWRQQGGGGGQDMGRHDMQQIQNTWYPEYTRPQVLQQAQQPHQQNSIPQQNGMPNLEQAWQQQYGNATHAQFGGGGGGTANFHPGAYQGPGAFNGGAGTANFHPGGYQGPGNLHAYQGAHFQGPQVQAQGHFQAPGQGAQVDQATGNQVMEALMNPSRYGSNEAKNTFDIFNRQLTQQGNADKQRIDEDMASRGIYASTTAGGRLGDLATNLNQQRADYATNLSTDQARQYQTDRGSAIAQALGYGGQQFGQGLAGFGANQQAGQQRFDQQMGAGQFGLQQNAQNFGQQAQQYGLNQQEAQNRFNAGMGQAQFGLNQQGQNFGQRAQQYGLNQGEAMNRYNSGFNNAQFGLQQQGQNYNQLANSFGLNQQAQQQGFAQQLAGLTGLQNFGQQQFGNQMETADFNANQDWRNNQLWLQMLGQT